MYPVTYQVSKRITICRSRPDLQKQTVTVAEDQFNVSAAESVRSSLARYSVNAGYLRARLGGALTYRMSPSWSLTGIVAMTYLTGNAKDSPIVEDIGSAAQAFGGALVNYRFSPR